MIAKQRPKIENKAEEKSIVLQQRTITEKWWITRGVYQMSLNKYHNFYFRCRFSCEPLKTLTWTYVPSSLDWPSKCDYCTNDWNLGARYCFQFGSVDLTFSALISLFLTLSLFWWGSKWKKRCYTNICLQIERAQNRTNLFRISNRFQIIKEIFFLGCANLSMLSTYIGLLFIERRWKWMWYRYKQCNLNIRKRMKREKR